MEHAVIQLDHLSKTFLSRKSRVDALKNVSLDIAPNQVFGFLGPNGAGKSTTVRLIMNLIQPTQGRVLFAGEDVRKNRSISRLIGAIVESACFYHFLSGRDNLVLLARTAGHNPLQIPALLDQVGLTGHEHKTVKNYSTGMKQRLGIAAALLGNPSLLILDEPTNGLDPAGMHEMRLFLRKLVDDCGKTVILSSHLLSEVELICDRVAILHRGEIAREGAVKALLSDLDHLLLNVRPVPAAIHLLQNRWQVERGESDGYRGWIAVTAKEDEAPAVVHALSTQGIEIFQASPRKQSLEDFFLETTQGEGSDD
ncbi:MAG: ABC transporter ATP-binding protein [Anaerolineales bacterium]|nr:ABC transporter ATP-binding protein [Anaerolineales bacterium]